MNAISALQQMDERSRAKWMGQSAEVNAAYDRIVQLAPEIQSNMLQMEQVRRSAGMSASPVEQGILRAQQNEDFVARDSQATGEIERDVVKRRAYGSAASFASEAKDRVRTRLTEQGAWAPQRWGADVAMDIADLLELSPRMIQSAGMGFAYRADSNWIRDEERERETIRKSLESAAKNLEASAENLRQSTTPKTAAQRAELGRHREN
jgi:hypothetical protein